MKLNAQSSPLFAPKQGQPDFGKLTFSYVPLEEMRIELKSLKLYLQQFRNEGIFYENVTNRILDDVAGIVQPKQMTLVAEWTPRGGIRSTITARFDGQNLSRRLR